MFQFIYDLNEPQSIGLVEADGRWTTLNFDSWIVGFKDLDRFVPFDELERQPALQERGRRQAHFTWQASQAVN